MTSDDFAKATAVAISGTLLSMALDREIHLILEWFYLHARLLPRADTSLTASFVELIIIGSPLCAVAYFSALIKRWKSLTGQTRSGFIALGLLHWHMIWDAAYVSGRARTPFATGTLSESAVTLGGVLALGGVIWGLWHVWWQAKWRALAFTLFCALYIAASVWTGGAQ